MLLTNGVNTVSCCTHQGFWDPAVPASCWCATLGLFPFFWKSWLAYQLPWALGLLPVVASVLAALSVVVYVPTAVQFGHFHCKLYLQYYYGIIEYSLHRIVRLLCGASELIPRRGRLLRVTHRNYFPFPTETLLRKLFQRQF